MIETDLRLEQMKMVIKSSLNLGSCSVLRKKENNIHVTNMRTHIKCKKIIGFQALRIKILSPKGRWQIHYPVPMFRCSVELSNAVCLSEIHSLTVNGISLCETDFSVDLVGDGGMSPACEQV